MTMTDVAALADGSLIVRIANPSSTRVAEGVNVSAKRTLTLAEIMARHQAAAARQADAISTTISTGSLTLTFEAPSFPAPMTIASRVVMFADGELVEIEQQDIRVNGLAFGGGRVPRLPIIEPERVASVPLAIELTDVYRYALAGTQTMEGTLCYVVRFAPAAGGRTLFRGTAWIAADDFGLVKVAATQVGLRGPIVSSDQVDTFARVDGVWLLRESRVNQIYEGAAHRTPIERVMTLDRTDVDPVNFESRRASVYASPNVMVRDTPQGYRYLRRGDPDERREPLAVPAIALERPATRVRTVALGMIADPNISHPLPFAGLSYVDFDLLGTGTQFNGFFGGTFGQMAFSMPSVAGSRWQIAGRAFAIASSFNDRSFDGGLERYKKNIRQRPAQASVWALRPLTPRVTLRVAYDFEYLHYSRADTTAPAFVVPASQTVHAARFAIEGQRHGWTASAWWSPAVRQRWRVWGDAGGDHYDPGHRDFQRYGASLARSTVVTPALVARGEIAWQDGHHLDRFSRYSFGAFDNRLRGYPGALIRYDRGAIARGAIGWSAAPRLRIDGFADAAFVRDPGFDPELRPVHRARPGRRVTGAVRHARRRGMGLRHPGPARRRPPRHARRPDQRLQDLLRPGGQAFCRFRGSLCWSYVRRGETPRVHNSGGSQHTAQHRLWRRIVSLEFASRAAHLLSRGISRAAPVEHLRATLRVSRGSADESACRLPDMLLSGCTRRRAHNAPSGGRYASSPARERAIQIFEALIDFRPVRLLAGDLRRGI